MGKPRGNLVSGARRAEAPAPCATKGGTFGPLGPETANPSDCYHLGQAFQIGSEGLIRGEEQLQPPVLGGRLSFQDAGCARYCLLVWGGRGGGWGRPAGARFGPAHVECLAGFSRRLAPRPLLLHIHKRRSGFPSLLNPQG